MIALSLQGLEAPALRQAAGPVSTLLVRFFLRAGWRAVPSFASSAARSTVRQGIGPEREIVDPAEVVRRPTSAGPKRPTQHPCVALCSSPANTATPPSS